MKAQHALLATSAVALLVVAPLARADWFETRLTSTPALSTEPIVTYDAFDALHVLWNEGGEIQHRMLEAGEWGSTDDVGIGTVFDHYTCLH